VEQYLLIAVTLSLTDIDVISVYASAARRLGRWLQDPQAIRLQNKAFGGLFVSAGTLLAIFSRSP
jgi:homoserine/homoserine lactone efflux protein